LTTGCRICTAPGEKAQAVEIAKAGNIPEKSLDTILGELHKAGIVYV
jgi:DNA-binding IscR family transcriptional regulator